MLTIHQSNRLDALASELASELRRPLASTFAAEVIVVQSRGVARWLSLRLADHASVCANVRFPFPGAFEWELYRVCIKSVPGESPFDPDALAWSILAVLPALEAQPLFAPVNAYVRGDPLRRFELAARLAKLYDEYQAYRPDWIAEWQRKRPATWQGALWKEVTQRIDVPHRALLHAELLRALSAPELRAKLPERVSLFGAPALAPSALAMFDALSRHSDVHLYIQNPCREYWGDIADASRVAQRTLERAADAALLDTGNTLLASLGKQGRDFFDLLQQLDGAREAHRFIEPAGDTILASIQRDILDLREPVRATCTVSAGDASVQVHSCHSAMREIEVLHDQLLALFQRHADLEPSDVVVMTPDIETYAPYIDSVFATAEPRIPFNVSDRSGEKESTLAATLLALLELHGSRYEAQRVLSIFDEASVRRRFGLSEGDVEAVRRWVREAHVRWGIDGEHRATFGLPATHEHTWRFGLDRLLLGYALPSGDERLFESVLAYDEIEGSLGESLGRFVTYVEAAIALDTDLAGSRSIARWCDVVQGVLSRFFDTPEERAEELEGIRAALTCIEKEARLAQFAEPVPLSVMLTVLRARLEVPARAFLSGGVTFCAMVPMRSLPFEVVCMIGMNDRACPRIQRRDGFDLMASDFRKGDRARREDDRYLFLESIVNARRCLYVSYTGRHIREDSVMPPSVLVSELLDYVERGYGGEEEGGARRALVTEHPLQAFSKKYFIGSRKLFSYSEAFARAASAAGRGSRRSEPFLTHALPPLDAFARRIDLETLVRFFRNPARHLFEQRLKVRLEALEDELESREPFELEGLPLYRLKEHLLEMALDDRSVAAVDLARASGVLPHGRMGEVLFERQNTAVNAVAAIARELAGTEAIAPLFFEFTGDEVTLYGTLARVTSEGMLVYRVANMNASVRVGAWLRHLALNAFPPPGTQRVSRCVAQDCMLTFRPVDDARDRLAELLALYWTGMHRPLPFFPRTAFQRAKGAAEYQVRTAWGGGFSGEGGECRDPYFALAFRGIPDALDAEFDTIARTVFGPILAATSEEPLP